MRPSVSRATRPAGTAKPHCGSPGAGPGSGPSDASCGTRSSSGALTQMVSTNSDRGHDRRCRDEPGLPGKWRSENAPAAKRRDEGNEFCSRPITSARNPLGAFVKGDWPTSYSFWPSRRLPGPASHKPTICRRAAVTHPPVWTAVRHSRPTRLLLVTQSWTSRGRNGQARRSVASFRRSAITF